MKSFLRTIVIVIFTVIYTPSIQALTVFDPANYKQNLLQALRSLEQIQNQVKELANQAQMLAHMDKLLLGIGESIVNDLKQNMEQIQSLLEEGDNIILSVKDVQNTYKNLFPKQFDYALSNDEILKKTQERFEAKVEAFERAAKIQAQIAENVKADQKKLAELLEKSKSAEVPKQVLQYGNEINALGVQQTMQLQIMMATQLFAENLQHSEIISREKEAEKRFQQTFGVEDNRKK